jgi:branched-chain amino acid transport system substrate-binding protein
MKTSTKIIIGATLVIIGTAIFSMSKQSSQPVSQKNFKVGAVLSLTGYGANDSESIKSGLELAKDDLMTQGINVTIDYQDDKTDPKQTVGAFTYFASQKPDVIIGPIWSYLVDAAAPVVEKNKTVTFTPSATSEYIQATSSYLFQGGLKNIKMVPVLSSELTKYHAKKVAVLNINGAWGVSMDAVFSLAIKDAGATRVLNETLIFGDEVDVMPAEIAKIKASQADAILWTGSKDGALALVKKLKEQNLNIPVIGTSGLRDIVQANLIEIKGLPVVVVTPVVSPEFVKKYTEKYGHAPNAYADTSYDGLMLLAEAKMKTTSQESMKDYLERTISYKGYSGTYTFDKVHDTSGGAWVATLLTK